MSRVETAKRLKNIGVCYIYFEKIRKSMLRTLWYPVSLSQLAKLLCYRNMYCFIYLPPPLWNEKGVFRAYLCSSFCLCCHLLSENIALAKPSAHRKPLRAYKVRNVPRCKSFNSLQSSPLLTVKSRLYWPQCLAPWP